MVIKRSMAYKVKYKACRFLHGSMKEHLGRYLQVIKDICPNTVITLLTPGRGARLVFQRLFIYFEGTRDGWMEWCRRFLRIDACFLKTFLGGHLMAAVGKDAND